jgi:protein-tyrosine phosphatase
VVDIALQKIAAVRRSYVNARAARYRHVVHAVRYHRSMSGTPDIVLVPVGGGRLALTHRPKLKNLPALQALGVTHLVTLLAEREGARQIGDAAIAAGLAWIWIPLDGGDVPSEAKTAELRAVLGRLKDIVAAGGQIVVHCSAGIHRTGMFGYALLRQLGLAADEARGKLAELRSVTAEGVGDDRLAWGDSLVDAPGAGARTDA